MTNRILQKAVDEFEKLSVDDQNAVATRWLQELEDERVWSEKFTATTDEQWALLTNSVKKEISKGDFTNLGSFLDESGAE